MAQGISIFNRVRGQQFVSVPGPEASPVWILPLTYRPMLDALVFMTAAEVLWKVCTHRPLKSFAQCYQMIPSSIQRRKTNRGEATVPRAKAAENKPKEIGGSSGSSSRPSGRQAPLPLDQGPAEQLATQTAS